MSKQDAITDCTRLANAGMNPKALQYIMGHANITMTLNYYAHATYDSAKAATPKKHMPIS